MKPVTSRAVNFLLTFCLTMMNLRHADCLYFTQLGYNVFAPSGKHGVVVAEMQLRSIPSIHHPRGVGVEVHCEVEGVQYRNHFHVKEPRKLFNNDSTVRLKVARALDKETYHVQVTCRERTNHLENCTTNVTVHVDHHDDRQRHHNVMETICRRPITFQLAENVDGVVLGTLPCASSAICPHDSGPDCYLVTDENIKNGNYSHHISLQPGTGRLTVERSFDREMTPQLNLTYVCPSKTNFTCNAELTILDVDDSGPWFQRNTEPVPFKYLEMKSRLYMYELKKGTSKDCAIIDKDLPSWNTYNISIDNDYNGLFSTSTYFPPSLRNYLSISVLTNRDVDLLRTNVTVFSIVVRIVDTTFVPSFNQTHSDNNTAICNITLEPPSLWKPVYEHSEFPNVSISPLASIYSQVYVMGYLKSTSEYRIETHLDYEYTDVTDLFKVTPREGIIYVGDSNLLWHLANQSLIVDVKTCAVTTNCTSVLNITVKVGDSTLLTQSLSEAVSCARETDNSSCESKIGLGAPEGYCSWRNSGRPLSSIYATCSPSLRTCPDTHCDELEYKIYGLCPQDCTTKTINTVTHPAPLNNSYVPPMGIFGYDGQCWCKVGGCTCREAPSNVTKATIRAIQESEVNGQLTELTATVASSGLERCGSSCRLMLLVGLTSLLVLTLGLVMWKCVYYRRKMQRMRGHGSGIVPSDYVVAPGSVTTDYTDYASTHLFDWHQQNSLDAQMVDPKWEFNRGYIKIESVLGEGEFGKVVKAQAWNIQGNPGHTTVAVKMLKECASGVEYRDLLSELNLLKQVNHRNVIKLLGVCTRKGPLYVIVEFCELGSLRSFLRRARGRKDYLVTRNLPTVVLEIQKESGKPSSKVTKDLAEEGVSVQDLLSFSWQIGKGMEYLSGMKVVHRDLAARNILLATGKVIKISDFGLSRDVYEGDAYLKTSKGPLPVKWMAPESLYDQICTTKSDIWSYGIVLWEIFTLGANPYPGTPAERLYHLLKTGYRMTKPPSCSDELFSVMLKCWQDSPDKRPTFKELADIFEQFLSLDKEYLDLNACDGFLSEDSAFLTSGDKGISQDAVDEEWKDPDLSSEVDRSLDASRPTEDETHGPATPYSVLNNIPVVSLAAPVAGPLSLPGSDCAAVPGPNTVVIPAEGPACTGANGGWVEDGVGENGEGRGAEDEGVEESNSLLLSSSQF